MSEPTPCTTPGQLRSLARACRDGEPFAKDKAADRLDEAADHITNLMVRLARTTTALNAAESLFAEPDLDHEPLTGFITYHILRDALRNLKGPKQ